MYVSNSSISGGLLQRKPMTGGKCVVLLRWVFHLSIFWAVKDVTWKHDYYHLYLQIPYLISSTSKPSFLTFLDGKPLNDRVEQEFNKIYSGPLVIVIVCSAMPFCPKGIDFFFPYCRNASQ